MNPVSDRSLDSLDIILVDDDLLLGRKIEKLLKANGYSVRTSQYAEEAKSIILSQTPQIAIVDGLLPDLPGTDLIKQVLQAGYEGHIIFISTGFFDSSLENYLKDHLGVTAVLAKPLDKVLLLERIHSILPAKDRRLTNRPETPLDYETDLTAEYMSSLPDKLNQLSSYLQDWKNAGAWNNAADNLFVEVHSLHGNAGSFGIPELSKQAAIFERYLMNKQDALPTEAAGYIESLNKILEARTKSDVQNLYQSESNELSLLIVDRDPVFRENILDFSSRDLISVEQTDAPEKAITMLKEKDFDAIIVGSNPEDPEDKVWRFINRVRFNDSLEKIPLVYASKSGEIRERIASNQAGCSLYLKKPLSFSDFTGAVRILKGLRRQGQAKILLVDDNASFLTEFSATLDKNSYAVYSATTSENVLDLLTYYTPDLLIIDLMMPQFSGLDICRAIRTMPQWYDLPVIMLTTDWSAPRAEEGYASGADDVISKKSSIEDIITRINLRVQKYRILHERSDRDPLTGLYNRRVFSEQFEMFLSNRKREHLSGTFCLLDIDNFKLVNDKYGHALGDQVLISFAGILQQELRNSDIICRWGGEEFAIFMPKADLDQSAEKMSKVLRRFKEQIFTTSEKPLSGVSFSGGLSSFPRDRSTLEGLSVVADERLYIAKNNGRSQIISRSKESN